MIDGIIKGDGNSRYLKSVADFLTQYPTYEAFAAALTAGTLPVDLNGINEDGWQQIGDMLNKGNLLQDVTCDLLSIARSSVPNDAFVKLALGPGKYGYRITVKTSSGTLLPGITVSGVDAINGDACITDENGLAIGVSTGQTVTLNVDSGFYDLKTANQKVVSTGTITDVLVILQAKTPNATFDTSASGLRFSPDVSEIDFCAVGAGGGGVAGSGPGGGGGFVQNLLNNKVSSNDVYKIVVGAKGTGSAAASISGGDGGKTSIYKNDAEILTANGGYGGKDQSGGYIGGAGNGKGGNGGGTDSFENGGNGSGYKFNSASLGLAGGGGGGSGCRSASDKTAGIGGSPYGGNGSGGNLPGSNASGPGGGGGGGGYNYSDGQYQKGGDGGPGIVYVRWR